VTGLAAADQFQGNNVCFRLTGDLLGHKTRQRVSAGDRPVPSESDTLTDPVAPVSAAERLAIVDILRGFALYGILTIHLMVFKAPWGPPGLGYSGPHHERLALLAVIFLIESKFFTLFSLLFGLGFAIQMLRAQQAGARFGPRYVRRLLALLLFGIGHVVVLWEGDILIIYALVGALLWFFRNASLRTLLVWACALVAIPLLFWSVTLVGIEIARRAPEAADHIRDIDIKILADTARQRTAILTVHADGSYLRILVQRMTLYRSVFFTMLSRLPTVLAMFLLGLYVGKEGILSDVEGHRDLLRTVRAWGLGLGLSASLLVTLGYAYLPPSSAMIALAFDQALAGPILCLGYGGTLTLFARTPSRQRLLRPLAMTGRMALTIYLLQSLIGDFIFEGYGLGLVGKMAPTVAIMLAAAIFAAQMALSCWWLARFRFGPMEWLWRVLTYGRQPT
jgi:uncharacterized protein